MKIRVAVGQFHDLTEERLRFAAQIGATGLQMNNPSLPGDKRWEEKDVRALADRVTAHGLKFEAIENVPTHFYHKAMMGLEGRDEQIENYQATIRAVARAGIPVLGYHFMPNSVWTTDRSATTRGGATARAFDMAVVDANAEDLAKLRSFMPTTLGTAASMPLYRQGRPDDLRRSDVEELRVFHQGRASGRRGRGHPAGAASRRSAGADAGRRRATVLPTLGL